MKSSSQKVKVGVVMDPIADINPQKDSTLAMMLGAQDLDADLFYMEQDDLFIKDGKAYAAVRPVRVADDPGHWYDMEEAAVTALGDLDFILMRKDPPVDKRFLHTCAMLEQAERDGAKVVNNPSALILYNEKIFATHFPAFCPPYVIGAALGPLQDFHRAHGKVILKPLDAMGGTGVFLLGENDVNFEVVWETLTARGTYPIVAQAFLPAIAQGDKRVIVIDGEPFGHALVRLPKKGSIRGNLAAGGSYEVQPLTKREREIGEAVGERLRREGVVFAGLDVIGDYLTEVNITSPTGLRQISKSTGTDLGRLIMEKVLR